MKKLIQDHYDLIRQRGLITDHTTFDEFINKITEEYQELIDAYIDDVFVNESPSDNTIHEITDLVMVCLHCLNHFGVDFEDELKKNIEVQRKRVIYIGSKDIDS